MPAAKRNGNVPGVPGLAVDAQGGQVIDPTANVIALVEANAKAVSDLREADNRYYDAVLNALKNSNEKGSEHLAEVAQIRAEYQKEIRESDLKVAAQTRLVDVGGQAASAASIATAVVTLQQTTDRNAETLRGQVASSSSALAKQVADAAAATAQQTLGYNTGIETRISSLEKGSNIGAGRQGVLDPQMAALFEKMDKLITATAAGAGNKEGSADTWKVVSAILAAAAIIVGFFAFAHSSSSPAVVYAPPPSVRTTPSQ